MSFGVPDHVRPIREKLLRFIEDHVYDAEPIYQRGGPEAEAIQAKLRDRAKAEGLWALGHPASMGGGGMPWLDYAYANEVIGRCDAAMDVFGTYSLQSCLMLDAAGTEAQKQTILYPKVRGDTYMAFSVTEPGAGSSDPTNIQTTARLEGDEWVINGRKWYVSGGDHADWICVMARTEPQDAPVHGAFSMILVPAGTPGLTRVRDMHVLGLTHMNHPEYLYEEVRVPAANLLGKRGEGFKLFQVRLGPARITNTMRWLGQCQRAFDLMCDRINSRKVSKGALLSTKQLMQQHVYDSYVEIQSARAQVIDAAEKLGKGEQARVEVSAIKVAVSRTLHNVIDRAIQVHGALGLSDDLPLETMYRMARVMRIVDGPDEVHVERVGKTILKEFAAGNGWDFGQR
ncbi:MAG: acyl-CoA dehydrogenase protein [Caulobacter sp.]|nr:acyl-CoA dehydrogenase protein [Caulobacter sp.]